MKITLQDLLTLNGSRLVHKQKLSEITFTGVSIDSRSCRKNDLFFAIKGERCDGHDFVEGAFKKGLKAAVVSKKWFGTQKRARNKIVDRFGFILVDDTLRSLGELARNHRNKFVIPVIAIGGSNGKTTCKDLIAHVLSKKYNVLKTEKNYNNNIGVPLTLLNLNKDNNICVIETGTNHFGEVAELCNIVNPQFGVITNIGKEHLEFFGNLKGVLKAELELVEYLKKNYGTFIWNKDDMNLRAAIKPGVIKCFSYGSIGNNDVSGRLKKFDTFYPVIEIKYGDSTIKTKLNTIGRQSYEAALCAAAIGYYFDVPEHGINEALAEFRPCSKGRNALLKKNRRWVIDDTYNSNPDSVRLALKNLKRYKVKGRKYVVLADMLELGRSSKKEHSAAGRLVKQMGFENLYTYGLESYNIFKGAKGVKNNFYFSEKNTLTEFLKLSLKEGDIVLVKGSRGMKMEEITDAL